MVVQIIVDFLVLGILGFLVSTTLLLWYLFLDCLVTNRIVTPVKVVLFLSSGILIFGYALYRIHLLLWVNQ